MKAKLLIVLLFFQIILTGQEGEIDLKHINFFKLTNGFLVYGNKDGVLPMVW